MKAAPKWISEAIEAGTVTHRGGEVFPLIRLVDSEKLAAALLDHLPIDRMVRAAAFGPDVNTNIPAVLRVQAARWIVVDALTALTDGDADVVTLTSLYQDASRALDVSGVPYANDDEAPVQLDLAARIRWLAMQRPGRPDLQRIAARWASARELRVMAADRLAQSNVHYVGDPPEPSNETLAFRAALRAECAAADVLYSAVRATSPTSVELELQRVKAERDEARAELAELKASIARAEALTSTLGL